MSKHITPQVPGSTTTAPSLDAFEAWLVEQQCSALDTMRSATGVAFTDACSAFDRPTAVIDALCTYRSHLVRKPCAASHCGRG